MKLCVETEEGLDKEVSSRGELLQYHLSHVHRVSTESHPQIAGG
jgi:hypothetical protein